MVTSYRQPGATVSHTVPALTTYTQGQLVVLDGLVGIVSLPDGTTGAAGDIVEVHRRGVYVYDKAAIAFTFGADVYYDATLDQLTNVAIGNTLVGVAIGSRGVMALAGAAQEQFALSGDAAAMLAAGLGAPFLLIADPGDGNAIPVTDSGNCAMTSAGAPETRTMAIPTLVGQQIRLSHDVDGGGNIAVTVAGGIDSVGNTIITFGDAGDAAILDAMQVAGALVWRIAGQGAGVALT
jgi:hypothetical protein